jgi:hypothetical protein
MPLASLPTPLRDQVGDFLAELRGMAVTDSQSATAELDKQNAARRTVWRDQAAHIPIVHGTAEQVLGAMLGCIHDDFSTRGAREVHPERVGSPPHKLILKTYAKDSFGKHEIMRVGENEFVGMPCTLGVIPIALGAAPGASRPEGMFSGRFTKVAIVVFALLVVATVINVMAVPEKASPRNAAAMALGEPVSVTIAGTGGPTPAARVKPGFFAGVAATPILGRLFVEADFQQVGVPVVVLGELIWRSQYGGGPQVIGRPIVIDGVNTIVVGVVSSDLIGPGGALIWMPARP